MQADYITVTADEAALYLEAEQFLVGNIWHRNLLGATGRCDEDGLFVGRFSNGRWIVSCAGARADDVMRVLALTDIQPSVARLDLQVTVGVDDADAIIRSIKPNARYKTLLAAPVGEGERGATLYIGAPKSRKRLRVYNKSAQSGMQPPLGEYLRIELQLRDAEADYYYSTLRAGGKAIMYKAYRNTVVAMAPALEGYLPVTKSAHVDIQVDRATRPRYDYWIRQSVIPGVLKAALIADQETRDALRDLREAIADV